MVALDRWAVHRARQVQQEIADAYARYDFAAVVQALMNFCSVDLGSLYLDVTKDRLYTMREDSRSRRSAQSAMFRIADAFARWIAPILSFTADEMRGHLPGERAGNVLFATWHDGLAPLPRMPRCRPATSTACSPARAGGEGAGTDARGRRDRRGAGSRDRAALRRRRPELAEPLADELRFLFISGDVRVVQDDGARGVGRAQPTGKGWACVRCWHHRADVGAHPAHPQLVRPLRVEHRRAGRNEDVFLMARVKPNALPWLGVSLLVFVLDQWSKAWVLSSLPEYTAVPVIDGFWNRYRTYNTGAAFSFSPTPAGGRAFFMVLAFAISG